MQRMIRVLVILCGLVVHMSVALALNVNKDPQVQEYIHYLNSQYGFNTAYLEQLFNKVTYNPTVLQRMEQAGQPMPWFQYRAIFIKPERVQQGAEFWRENRVALARAQSQYGVPAAIIAGILGEETSYGSYKGSFSTLDALSTLAFRYPRRAGYFRNELTHFLLLCREQQWNPLTIKGSYAGALGLPQFMPSSYRTYAVDYHNDGVKDLFNNNEDVIVSIANYLQKKGWKANQPIASPARVTNSKVYMLADQQGKPKYTVKQLRHYGMEPVQRVSAATPAGVLFLKDKDSDEAWLTFNNFSVIKRYNTSNYYAMVAYQLGNLVQAAATKKTKG